MAYVLLNFTFLITVFIWSFNILVMCVVLLLTSTHLTLILISQLVVLLKTVEEKRYTTHKNYYKTHTHASRSQLLPTLSHIPLTYNQLTCIHFIFSIHLSTLSSQFISPLLFLLLLTPLHLISTSMVISISPTPHLIPTTYTQPIWTLRFTFINTPPL